MPRKATPARVSNEDSAPMSATEFRRKLEQLGLLQLDFAAIARLGKRTVRNYADGTTPVPGPVAMVLRAATRGDLALERIR